MKINGINIDSHSEICTYDQAAKWFRKHPEQRETEIYTEVYQRLEEHVCNKDLFGKEIKVGNKVLVLYGKSLRVKTVTEILERPEHARGIYSGIMVDGIKNPFKGSDMQVLSVDQAFRLQHGMSKLCYDAIQKQKNKKEPIILNGHAIEFLIHEGLVDNDLIHDATVIGSRHVKLLDDMEYDHNFRALDGCRMFYESDGYHDHDGQNVDYTIVLIDTKGNRFEAYDRHNLVCGWDLEDKLEFVHVQ